MKMSTKAALRPTSELWWLEESVGWRKQKANSGETIEKSFRGFIIKIC